MTTDQAESEMSQASYFAYVEIEGEPDEDETVRFETHSEAREYAEFEMLRFAAIDAVFEH